MSQNAESIEELRRDLTNRTESLAELIEADISTTMDDAGAAMAAPAVYAVLLKQVAQQLAIMYFAGVPKNLGALTKTALESGFNLMVADLGKTRATRHLHDSFMDVADSFVTDTFSAVQVFSGSGE